MDWYSKKKTTGVPVYSPPSYTSNTGGLSPYANHRNQVYTSSSRGASSGIGNIYHSPVPSIVSSSPTNKPNTNTSNTTNTNNSPNDTNTNTPGNGIERDSYYLSQLPLYCSDWTYMASEDRDCIALSTYKEGFSNKLQILHGISYGESHDYIIQDEIGLENASPTNPGGSQYPYYYGVEGFDFHKVAEATLDYPVTNLQWDPSMKITGEQRVAASSEVLRLYKLGHENDAPKLVQTHILANNTSNPSSSNSNKGHVAPDDTNTFPPVTSFDWNKTDPNIIITSSVDTTCTVWDLNRSHNVKNDENGDSVDTACVMTQLIAHDSEVFDVRFIHNSSNIFASVGNDGSMRVFDLRSLEHSTIIYEPTQPVASTPSGNWSSLGASAMSTKALLKLSTSNIDQHHLATVGINSNQVIIIDMRMPGLPVATLDGSIGGINSTAINSIKWHPSSNYLLTGGDDCQALVWDCNNIQAPKPANSSSGDSGLVVDTPSFAYEEELEVNNVCWRQDQGDWMGVVSGKGFQAVSLN